MIEEKAMPSKTLDEAIKNPVTNQIWSVIREVTGHIDCPLCDAPKKAEALITHLDKDLSLQEIANLINIPKQKIKEHIKSVLQLNAVEIYARIALLKIIASIDKSPELLSKVKASDIIKAISTLTLFEGTKGKSKITFNIPEHLQKTDSFSLMQSRDKLKEAIA